MAKKDTFDWLSDKGEFSGNFDFVNPDNIENELERLSAKLVENIQRFGKSKKVIDSGALLSDSNFSIKKSADSDKYVFELFMLEYADYVNQGVKGYASSKNAPNSPYQFKSKGMNEEGRKSIIESIKRGNMRLSDTSKTKVRVGLEAKYKAKTKRKSIIEKQADRIIWNIKKYGIKETGYLTDAINETFKDYDKNMVKAFYADFLIRLNK